MQKWRERVFAVSLALTLVINLIVEWRRNMEQRCDYCENPKQTDMECVFCGSESKAFKWLKLSLMVAVTFVLLGIGSLFAQERGTLVKVHNRIFCDSVETVKAFAEYALSLPNEVGITYALKSGRKEGIKCWTASGIVMYQEPAGKFTITITHRLVEMNVIRFSSPIGESIFSWETNIIGSSA